jgi:SNF2 family DNA or RNA helicase
MVLTTYGVLRQDIDSLKDVDFDYAILDEAQAIKNAATVSARAARLLRARHRLVLTGTPIENRLDDLWSLFDFLNPGLVDASRALAPARSTGSVARVGPDETTRRVIGRALRPLILRRSKEQVAPELPRRTEQTLLIDLEGPQRKLYDTLRDAFRADLLRRVDRDGMARSRMHVLEALLRLRQAACHPALLGDEYTATASAKLDALLPRLEEVVGEGHKALVFSQFTSLLALVEPKLARSGVVYEYLDGRTRNRGERVKRFQEDAACAVFLISLKAGGQGLNLTAADYVFLLDPWWNPAVEAQAIDRAHRIGQEKPVLALRLIARNTVEEKVLELQQSKRELADAILNDDRRGIAGIGREELELLLG